MKVSEEIYNTLRQRLISHYYEPEQHLKEELIASEFNVSRTPVRAAFKRLSEEGLLSPAPKRGAIVPKWRKTDVEDVFSLRILLESYGAEIAARKISPEQINELTILTDKMESSYQSQKPKYLSEIQKANRRFHQVIYEACGSSHLRMFANLLHDFPMVLGGFSIYSNADIGESIHQHREIISALRSGNSEWAKAAMTCHLNASMEIFRRTSRDEELKSQAI